MGIHGIEHEQFHQGTIPKSTTNMVLDCPIPHRIIVPLLRRLLHLLHLLICNQPGISHNPKTPRTEPAKKIEGNRNIPSTTALPSPFLRFRLFRTSLDRKTLYNNHPATQFGPYSPLVPPRSKRGRVSGPALRQISITAQRCRSGRMWCQKKGGRVLGSARMLSSRLLVSWFRRL